MNETFLLGATKYDEIVFGNLRLYNDGKLGISFYNVRPFKESDINEAYVEDYLYGYGKEQLYDFCMELDCTPKELPLAVLNTWDIIDIVDCSLYGEWYTINGEDWYFESCSCGQHDTREDMIEYTNKEGYDLLHELWDANHLKQLNNEDLPKLDKITELLTMTDDEIKDWIISYIEDNLL